MKQEIEVEVDETTFDLLCDAAERQEVSLKELILLCANNLAGEEYAKQQEESAND